MVNTKVIVEAKWMKLNALDAERKEREREEEKKFKQSAKYKQLVRDVADVNKRVRAANCRLENLYSDGVYAWRVKLYRPVETRDNLYQAKYDRITTDYRRLLLNLELTASTVEQRALIKAFMEKKF